MAKRDSIFSDDWRECLGVHYQDVTRRNDKLTEKTLVPILLEVGFSEAELRDLKLQATLRAEDLHGDFVPDLDVHMQEESAPAAIHAGVDLPPVQAEEADIPLTEAELIEAETAQAELAELENDPLLEGEAETEAQAEAQAAVTEEADQPPADDDDLPEQMSLF